ncbi:MAG: hypothetical protein IPL61_36330 [Myxococcales bacterium]|nr:hypothetical protein [Myxococcales bacterium]
MRRTSVLLATLALAAACDDGGSSITDAGPSDAPSADGDNQPDAAPAQVRVVVVDEAGPVAAVPVYFQDADGALVALQPTGADGVASVEMAAGGSVTALLPDPFNSAPRLATILAVAPGDVLRIRAPGAQLDVLLDLTIPADGTNGHYAVWTSCGSADVLIEPGSTVTFPVSLYGCGATTDFVVTADNGDGGPRSTFTATDVAVTNGQAVTLTGTYAAEVDGTLTYSNLGAGVSFMELGRAVVSSRGLLRQESLGVDVVAGVAAGTLTVPPLPAGLRLVASARGSEGSFSQHVVLEAPTAGDYTLDTTGLFLPVFTASASFDDATHAVTWTEATTGATPDLTFISLEISRSATKSSWTWDVVAPHDAAEVQLPVLPGAAAEYNAAAGDNTFIFGHLTAKVPGGYAAARPVALAIGSAEELAGGLTGRIVIEQQLLLFKRRR